MKLGLNPFTGRDDIDACEAKLLLHILKISDISANSVDAFDNQCINFASSRCFEKIGKANSPDQGRG